MAYDPDKLHDKAMEDSAKNEYNPPHERPLGIVGEMIDPYSDSQIEDRKSYHEQWKSNRENIKKQR